MPRNAIIPPISEVFTFLSQNPFLQNPSFCYPFCFPFLFFCFFLFFFFSIFFFFSPFSFLSSLFPLFFANPFQTFWFCSIFLSSLVFLLFVFFSSGLCYCCCCCLKAKEVMSCDTRLLLTLLKPSFHES